MKNRKKFIQTCGILFLGRTVFHFINIDVTTAELLVIKLAIIVFIVTISLEWLTENVLFAAEDMPL